MWGINEIDENWVTLKNDDCMLFQNIKTIGNSITIIVCSL